MLTLDGSMVTLFVSVTETLGCGASLKKLGPWRLGFWFYSLPLTPSCSLSAPWLWIQCDLLTSCSYSQYLLLQCPLYQEGMTPLNCELGQPLLPSGLSVRNFVTAVEE